MNDQNEGIKIYIKKIGLMLAIGVLTFGVIYGFELISSQTENVPQQFQVAYREAADSGQKVVALTRSVNEKIEKINDLDLQGESEKSLTLIQETIEENKEAQQEAETLSESLVEISSMLEAIRGSEKAQIILEAIQIESELVSEFKSYSENIDTFLVSLEEAIETNSINDRMSVQEKLASINEKKQVINSLNNQFVSKLEELNNLN